VTAVRLKAILKALRQSAIIVHHMKGKVCMITGANSGIGKVIALELAKMGAQVVMVCRSKERGESARAEIEKASGNDRVELMLADFTSMESVRDLASEFKKKHGKLHVLVNNIGIIATERRVTPDGLEEQFEVNHLSHFLLTHLLLDVLKASAPSRIINTSSGIHKMGRIDFEDLQSESKYKVNKVYGKTKLMNVYFTYELARRLVGTDVTVNSYTPGFCKTRLDREYSSFMRSIVSLLAKKKEKGARTGIYLASSPAVERVTGKYFSNMKESKSSPRSYEKEIGLRLWKISEELANLTGFWDL